MFNAVRSLGRVEFTNGDASALADQLARLHPDNRHVKDKIRQQLQVLPPSPGFGVTSRDAGLLFHVGRGEWRLALAVMGMTRMAPRAKRSAALGSGTAVPVSTMLSRY